MNMVDEGRNKNGRRLFLRRNFSARGVAIFWCKFALNNDENGGKMVFRAVGVEFSLFSAGLGNFWSFVSSSQLRHDDSNDDGFLLLVVFVGVFGRT